MRRFQCLGDRLGYVVASLLPLVLAAELACFARLQSQTIDEADHIHAGYRYWQCGDYGVNPEHPPFAKLVDTLPLVFDRLQNPGPRCVSYETGTFPDFAHGHDFLYSNDAGRILAEPRLAAASFTLLLATFVFVVTRRMFGNGPALLALLLLVFEPTVLAHGAEVTRDVPVTCWLFIAVYAFYRYTETPTVLRLILSGLAAGLALVTKHSAAVLLLVLVLLAVADIWIRQHGSESRDFSGVPVKWKRLLVRNAVGLAAIVSIATMVLWGFYLFRYSARPAGREMSDSLTTYIHDAVQYGGVHGVLLSQVVPRLVHSCPNPICTAWQTSPLLRQAVLCFFWAGFTPPATGFISPSRSSSKVPLPFLLMLVVTRFATTYLWRQKKRETLFLAIPAVVFFSMSLNSRELRPDPSEHRVARKGIMAREGAEGGAVNSGAEPEGWKRARRGFGSCATQAAQAG